MVSRAKYILQLMLRNVKMFHFTKYIPVTTRVPCFISVGGIYGK